MTSIENQIINLIISQDENDQVDFKKEYYSKEKKYDLIKDIVSFANNIKPKDKYIVFGVENSTWNVLGIDRASLPDISEINNLLHSYVEPFIDVELGYLDYQGVTIGFIRIPHHDLNRPYVISKEYNKNKGVFLRKGEIYTRKGATNFIAERSDLDCIYHNKGTLDINPSILKYLYDINKELVDSGRAPIIVMGVLKTGAICDYFKMIGPSVKKNSIYAVSDEFRNKYINFDREPSSTTFGAETYYGQDFLLKTETGKLFVFNALLPYRDKHNKIVFKKEKSNLLNYKNIGTYIKLIEEFECDLDSTSIVPIALAQRYTAISLEPGGQVLDLLAKSNFQ